MLQIKRLYTFILQTFLPLFLMTFCICLFIVLMQFLWKYIDELVGKGLDVSVIAELFLYAAMTMVPLALPLAILLASLMVFGNLGEKFELTAMKAAGVSLFKVMSPLIIFVSFVAVGAFFFQNDLLPKAQVKMWTLLYSMRQKSPELDIPEGAFYDQIPGYNLYIKEKDLKTGMLRNMMIYDVSKGFGTASIIVADSGKMSFTEDKKHLFLHLYQGESFEDLKDERPSTAGNMMYRRESFSSREILIPFDANFNRMDDQTMKNQYIGKNLTELNHTIDSVNVRIDSIGNEYGKFLLSNPYMEVRRTKHVLVDNKMTEVANPPIKLEKPVDIDSIINSSEIAKQGRYLSTAISNAKRMKEEYEFKSYLMESDRMTIRRHKIELLKKFTLSIACLIFFFIGAPLGSIIRKGGLAIPVVVSVLLFIVYYIIDNTGYKLAREGIWEVWQGMWLSTFVLLPLGIFFTYKAVNDSAVFNADAYNNFFKRITGANFIRLVEMKEIVMDDVVPDVAIEKIDNLNNLVVKFLEENNKRQSYVKYWLEGYNRHKISEIEESLEDVVKYLSNSQKILVIHKLMDYPVIRHLLFYHPTNYKWISFVAIVLFPLGLIGYWIGTQQQKQLRKDFATIIKVNGELPTLLLNDKNNY